VEPVLTAIYPEPVGSPDTVSVMSMLILTSHYAKVPQMVCYIQVTFQVLLVAIVKVAVVWDVAPCSLVAVSRRFGDACCLLHQDDYVDSKDL
jgi:hypothetical protein